jgi:hypothetical protein
MRKITSFQLVVSEITVSTAGLLEIKCKQRYICLCEKKHIRLVFLLQLPLCDVTHRYEISDLSTLLAALLPEIMELDVTGFLLKTADYLKVAWTQKYHTEIISIAKNHLNLFPAFSL